MEDLKFLHEQINELWKIVKAHWPAKDNFNEKYWNGVIADVEEYSKKYPQGNLGYHLILAYLNFLQHAKKED